MMDKENHDLNLDQDFVADLGVPFICPNCNELFGSQEYLNQHSDICHSIKHGFISGTNNIFQSKELHRKPDAVTSPLPLPCPSNHKPYSFQQNLMATSGVPGHEPSHRVNFNAPPTTSYSAFPSTHQSISSAFHNGTQESSIEFPHVTTHRNDVLLSSSTDNPSHAYHQLPAQLAPQLVAPKPVSAAGNSSQQLPYGLQSIACPGCHNTYVNQWFLDQHVKHCLPLVDFQKRFAESAEGPLACPRCKLIYVNRFFLSHHMISCSGVPHITPFDVSATTINLSHTAQCPQGENLHQGPNKEQPSHNALPRPDITGTPALCTSSVAPDLQSSHPAVKKVDNASNSLHTCPQCGRNFAQKSSLEAHVRVHNGDKPFECEECGQKFVIKSNLKKHYRTHTQEKPYLCTECGDSFSLKTGLTRHWRIHTGEKPFECSECGQRFSSTGNLKKHAAIHINDKGFSCKVCGRRFPNEKALEVHVVIHTGEKSFQCPMCDSAFLHRGGLEAHFRVHTGEKPYPCGLCDLTFARRGGLKAHMRTHTGEKPYVCLLCGQAFAHKSNLNAHNRTHTGEKPFGCTYCDQKFAHKSNLKKHVNTHMDRTIASSPAGSLSDSSCAVSETSVASSAPVISAVTKMTSVRVSPFSYDHDSKFFDFLDMMEHPSSQALLHT